MVFPEMKHTASILTPKLNLNKPQEVIRHGLKEKPPSFETPQVNLPKT